MKRFFLIGFGLVINLIQTFVIAQTFKVTQPYVNQHGKLMTTVVVNGQKGNFLIDTGAPCCVSFSFSKKIGLKKGMASKGQDSNGNSITSYLVVLDSLRLGPTTFKHLEAMQWEESNLTEQFGVDGILGYNLFNMGVLTLDDIKKQYTFANDISNIDLSNAVKIPLINDPFLTLFTVQLGENILDTVMFDSGAKDLYELSERNYQRLKVNKKHIKRLNTGKGVLSMGAAGLEEKTVKNRVKIPRFLLGNYVFCNVPSITTYGYDSRIGTDLLYYGKISIDYRQRYFYFIPYKASLQDVYKKEWEVVVIVQNNQLTAGMVWNNKLPIKSGDKIVAINGQRFDAVNLVEATTKPLINLRGNKASLTFIDAKGKEKTITIKKY